LSLALIVYGKVEVPWCVKDGVRELEMANKVAQTVNADDGEIDFDHQWCRVLDVASQKPKHSVYK